MSADVGAVAGGHGVTDAMVEAAAVELWDYDERHHASWAETAEGFQFAFRVEVRRALAAALATQPNAPSPQQVEAAARERDVDRNWCLLKAEEYHERAATPPSNGSRIDRILAERYERLAALCAAGGRGGAREVIEQQAARWRFVRRFFDTDGDAEEMGATWTFVIVANEDALHKETCRDGIAWSVESLIDAAIAGPADDAGASPSDEDNPTSGIQSVDGYEAAREDVSRLARAAQSGPSETFFALRDALVSELCDLRAARGAR